MYQALYRKYRPRRFGDVAGQEHITETLRRQMVSGRLSHSYLFVGTRGTGKTTCAKILSRAVNCLNPEEGEPCNKCTACAGIEDGSILDVLELDAASNNSVDNVRALRDEAIYSPATVKKRVYIVDEVHMLSLSAFNALLKILEEPPEHILFILATTELHKVPATIQGRCQKFLFKRLSPSVLVDRLNLIASSERLTLTGEAVARLAALADGSMRDGISLLDQCASDDVVDLPRVLDTLGLTGRQEVLRLSDMIASRDAVSALGALEELYDDGRDMASLLGEMASLIRDLLVYRLSPGSGLISADYDHTAFSVLSGKMTPERMFYCLDVLKTAITGLTRGGSSKLSVEMCLIKMCDERLSDDTMALVSRVSQLEAEALGGDLLSASVSSGVREVFEATDGGTDAVNKAGGFEAEATDEPSDSDAEVDGESLSVAVIPIAAEAGDFWTETLDLLKSEPSVHALLSDSSKIRAQQDGSALIITVADSFTANLVASEFSELIKEAAAKVLGSTVLIRVEEGSIKDIVPKEDKLSKLESLSSFGIVNIE